MDVFPSEGVKECRRTCICSVGIHYKERISVLPYPVAVFAHTVSEKPCFKTEDAGQCKTKDNNLFIVERCISQLYC